MSRPSKFEELRNKTDQQLIRLIESGLDLGIRVAHQILNSKDRWTPSVEESYSKAEEAHAEASRLMPLIREISEIKFNQLEARREHLGELLEALAATSPVATPKEIHCCSVGG